MKNTLLAVLLAVAPLPGMAEESDLNRGLGLLEQGAALMLQGLLAEIEPRLAELEEALKDLHGYHPPEVLPNGDILIRRRTPDDTPKPDENGEIEL